MDIHNLYFVPQSFRLQANAGAKPSTDIEDTLTAMGAHTIGLPRAYYKHDKAVHLRDIINTLIVKATMPRGKTILLQYPAQHDIDTLARLAKKRHNHLILWVHDINELRGRPHADHPAALQAADTIIAHTPAMKQWLATRYPHADIKILGMFDYNQPQIPVADPPQAPTIVFAGNLAKSTFLQNITLPEPYRLVLYGVGLPDQLTNKPFVDYRGSCMPQEIPARIAAETYGLVWDGESTRTCTGPTGEYLRYNAPYKLSSYIAAGLPVIIWDQMGIAPYVEQQGIGIAIPDLNQLPARLSSLTPAQYNAMRQAARRLQAQISQSHHTRQILNNLP